MLKDASPDVSSEILDNQNVLILLNLNGNYIISALELSMRFTKPVGSCSACEKPHNVSDTQLKLYAKRNVALTLMSYGDGQQVRKHLRKWFSLAYDWYEQTRHVFSAEKCVLHWSWFDDTRRVTVAGEDGKLVKNWKVGPMTLDMKRIQNCRKKPIYLYKRGENSYLIRRERDINQQTQIGYR